MEVQHPFMKLPEEVRAMIFNQMSQTDVLEMRLSCKLLKTEIDQSFQFTHNLEDSKHDQLQRVTGLKVKTLIVTELIMPTYVPLRYPNWVKKLIIETEFITLPNLLLLLQQLASSLERITITSDVIMIPPATDTQIIGFPKLKVLKLRDQLHLSTRRANVAHEGTLVKVLKCENLVAFKFSISTTSCPNPMAKICEIWPKDLFNFMTNCQKSIKKWKICIQSFCRHHPPTAVHNVLDLPTLDQMLGLQKFTIQPCHSQQVTAKLQDLLLQQSGLEKVRIRDFFTNHLSGPGVHRNLILNNKTSLQSLDILDFGWEGRTDDGTLIPFDLGILSECINLTTLKISRDEQRRPRVHPYRPELVNCASLPHGLKNLDISDLLFATDDMFLYISNRDRSGRLETLELASYTPEETGCGVTPRIMHKILRLPRIMAVLVDNFSTPRYSRDVSLLEALSLNFHFPINFGNPVAVVQIKRASLDHPWIHQYRHI